MQCMSLSCSKKENLAICCYLVQPLREKGNQAGWESFLVSTIRHPVQQEKEMRGGEKQGSKEMYLKIYSVFWERRYLLYIHFKIILLQYIQYDGFINLQGVFNYPLSIVFFLWGEDTV